MITTNKNTFHQPGESFLHKVDPRLKLCTCVLVVVVTFAAGNWLQLLLPLLAIVLALILVAPLPPSFWRVFWMLRWLILFTLLMHLLFTDGRTLLGMSWLSLDGLYNGIQVSLQMFISVAAAVLLSLTTSVEDLVAAFGWIATPCKWSGCDTDEWQKTLMLTVHFVPVVRDEMKGANGPGNDGETTKADYSSRWQSMGFAFKSFVNRLLTKGDTIAHELVAETTMESEPKCLPGLLPLTLQDQMLLVGCSVMMLVYWLIGW